MAQRKTPEPHFHDRLRLRCSASAANKTGNRSCAAMAGGWIPRCLPDAIVAAYRLSANHYNGTVALQLIPEHRQLHDI